MEEAKQLASVVDLVVCVNYNTLHIHRTWYQPGQCPGMPGPAAAYACGPAMSNSSELCLVYVGKSPYRL